MSEDPRRASSPDGPRRFWPVTLDFAVRTYDIDAAGLVSNIVFIRWLEDLRLTMLEKHYPLEPLLARGQGPVLRRTEIDYRHPVRFGDPVHGRMWIAGLRKARFDLEAEFTVGEEVVAAARQQGYFVDYRRMAVLPVPEDLRARLTEGA